MNNNLSSLEEIFESSPEEDEQESKKNAQNEAFLAYRDNLQISKDQDPDSISYQSINSQAAFEVFHGKVYYTPR